MNINALCGFLGISQPVKAATPPARPAIAPFNYSRPALPPRYPPMHARLQLDLAQTQARADRVPINQAFVYTLTCDVEPGPLLVNIISEICYLAPAYGMRVTNVNGLEIKFRRIPFYPRYLR